MKETIKKQSKNQVKDLLNDYVVSPLNEETANKLGAIGQQLEDLNKTIKDGNDKLAANNGRMKEALEILHNNFKSDFEEDAFENVAEKIEDSIGDSKKSITQIINDNQEKLVERFSSIDIVLSQLQTVLTAAKSANETGKTELLSDAKARFDQLSELLRGLKSASESSTAETQNALKTHQTSLENAQQALSAELQALENTVKARSDTLSEQLAAILQAVSAAAAAQEKALDEHQDKTDTALQNLNAGQQQSMEHKYKALLAIFLTFGIVNTIGIIAMIVLFMLR